MDVNRAPRETLLRIPGIGAKAVQRILSARRFQKLRLDDIKRLSNSIKRAMPFIIAADWSPGSLTDDLNLRARFAPKPAQLDMFAEPTALSA